MDTTCYATAAHANDANPKEARATTEITGSSYGVEWTLPACDKHAQPNKPH